WRLQRQPPQAETGMAAPDNRIAAVPGNHDHWGGQKSIWPRAYSPYIFPDHFRRAPWYKLWTSSLGTLQLEIYGIDSNSGLKDQQKSLRARGGFSREQLVALENLLIKNGKEEIPQGVYRIRAIITHHSLWYTSRLQVLGLEELDDTSRDDLLALAERHHVSAVLTGHTHDSGLIPPKAWPVWELRSAATLKGPAKSGLRARGFLAHRLSIGRDGPTWSVWRLHWNGARFERKADTPCEEFLARSRETVPDRT